ncbi:MAG: undecaprenyl-diphosphate phosphatase [Acidobacteria bacterium]|nr:undecaprenyl-diphosphate phosphatase [Acidobacteriota bacterium]
MELYQVVILAVVQGLTEFLPVSSSAHLYLAPWLLGWPDQGLTFDIGLHLGTLTAVLGYFFRDWLQVLAQGFGIRYGEDEDLRQNPRLLWYLAAASLPIGVLGLAFKHHAETTLRSPLVMGVMLIGVGVLMWIADRRATARQLGSISLFDALLIGTAQALAIVPGTSRSGITITAGLFRGLDRAAAARFSFLLSTPAILAAGAKALYDAAKEGHAGRLLSTEFFLGMGLTAMVGCVVIALFMRFLARQNLRIFIGYRIVFGIVVIALAIFRR